VTGGDLVASDHFHRLADLHHPETSRPRTLQIPFIPLSKSLHVTLSTAEGVGRLNKAALEARLYFTTGIAQGFRTYHSCMEIQFPRNRNELLVLQVVLKWKQRLISILISLL
jgi:hypothetical protein